jgi:hypothetical protein
MSVQQNAPTITRLLAGVTRDDRNSSELAVEAKPVRTEPQCGVRGNGQTASQPILGLLRFIRVAFRQTCWVVGTWLWWRTRIHDCRLARRLGVC